MYLVRFTSPGKEKFFAVNPFDHHALYGTREQACEFDTIPRAQTWINLNIHGAAAFWESEKEHAKRTRERLRGWKVDIISKAQG